LTSGRFVLEHLNRLKKGLQALKDLAALGETDGFQVFADEHPLTASSTERMRQDSGRTRLWEVG